MLPSAAIAAAVLTTLQAACDSDGYELEPSLYLLWHCCSVCPSDPAFELTACIVTGYTTVQCVAQACAGETAQAEL